MIHAVHEGLEDIGNTYVMWISGLGTLALDELDLAVEGILELPRLDGCLHAYPVRHRSAFLMADEGDKLVGHGRVHTRVDQKVLWRETPSSQPLSRQAREQQNDLRS